jgi:hypothetical protein
MPLIYILNNALNLMVEEKLWLGNNVKPIAAQCDTMESFGLYKNDQNDFCLNFERLNEVGHLGCLL